MCECIVCAALTSNCAKCGEIQSKIQELKDLIEEHIQQFREELMTNSTMNYIHIDAIQLINVRIKQLKAMMDYQKHIVYRY